MSELPNLDETKVLQRAYANLAKQLSDALLREAHLEILAEALRDQRDSARSNLEELQNTQK